MDFRQIPGILLTVTGVLLLASVVAEPPSAAQGGPAVGYALFVAAVLGGGGSLAALAGLYSLRTRQIRLPAVFLAGYGAVGIVYAVIRLHLLQGLSTVGFSIVAISFVALVISGTFLLTGSDGEQAIPDSNGRA